jgi:hypothetical protein
LVYQERAERAFLSVMTACLPLVDERIDAFESRVSTRAEKMPIVRVYARETLRSGRNKVQSIERPDEDCAFQRREVCLNLPKELLRRPCQIPEALFEIVLELAHEGFEHIMLDGAFPQLPMKCGRHFGDRDARGDDATHFARQSAYRVAARLVHIEFGD